MPNRGDIPDPSKRFDQIDHFRGNEMRDGRGHVGGGQTLNNRSAIFLQRIATQQLRLERTLVTRISMVTKVTFNRGSELVHFRRQILL
jgi:hypothetical protein